MSLFRKIDGSPLWSDDYEEIIDDERDNRRILSLYDFSNGKRDNKIEKEQLNIIDNAVELLQKIYSDISFKLIIPSHTSLIMVKFIILYKERKIRGLIVRHLMQFLKLKLTIKIMIFSLF